MAKWRIIATVMTLVAVLAAFNILGFHEPAFPGSLILIIGAFIIWCVCDAVSAIKENGRG